MPLSDIQIDTFRCSGCGTCTEMSPDIFVLNPVSGKAELVNPNQPVTEEVRRAAAFCPEKCILLPGDEIAGVHRL